MKTLGIIRKLYITVSVIALTTVLLLLVVVFVMVQYESKKGVDLSKVNPRIYNKMISRDTDSLRQVYPKMLLGEVQGLLLETWTRPYLYEPFTQFKERPYSGKHVNVDHAGFRHIHNQAPWPPRKDDFVIFVFGGSTTFGYGVSDAETIPSHLMDKLLNEYPGQPLAVYNFGRGFYYSTQERILFEQLAANGIVPSLAIFIDGLNEFYNYDNRPLMTEELQSLVDQPIKHDTFTDILADLEKQSLAFGNYLQQNIAQNKVKFRSRQMNDDVVRVYLSNKRHITAISAEYGVTPVFVWQPIPTYKYAIENHLFRGKGFGRHIASGTGYAYMSDLLERHPESGFFLWLADLQEGIKEPLYVDQVHYTAKFSSAIAEKISNYIIGLGIIKNTRN